MVKVNSSLLPLKAHYFFFMAAMGPILPFLPVIGKQLGVSEIVMGLLMSVIPVLFIFAKPVFGFVLDYFQSQRKTVFIVLIISTTVTFTLLQFVHVSKAVSLQQKIDCQNIFSCMNESSTAENFICKLQLRDHIQSLKVNFVNHSYCSLGKVICAPGDVADLTCLSSQRFYSSPSFWVFVVLLSVGSTGYNVANSVSDAICFDFLGGGSEGKYGQQRVWGTVGFGLSALLGGYCVDLWSGQSVVKDYMPAFLIAIIFTSVDLLCCSRLKLPVLPKSSNIIKDVSCMMRKPSIVTFLVYAAFVGMCESFIIFFLFWYLEDLAVITGTIHHIKLLQGFTVAAETLVGEILFFPLSGKILKAVGYRHCLSLCFLAYSLRLGLLSLISNPWWALPIELLQGPSYALSYTTIVAYASAISPPGTSATMQGIAAGIDDGFGYSVGSLIGGLMYKSLGGSMAFRVFSVFAFICSITHWTVHILFLRDFRSTSPTEPQKQEKRGMYNPPNEAAELVIIG